MQKLTGKAPEDGLTNRSKLAEDGAGTMVFLDGPDKHGKERKPELDDSYRGDDFTSWVFRKQERDEEMQLDGEDDVDLLLIDEVIEAGVWYSIVGFYIELDGWNVSIRLTWCLQ